MELWRNWQRVGFQIRRLGVQIPLASLLYLCELGLVGYDDCLTRSRSRVQFSELVHYYYYYYIIKFRKINGVNGLVV
jgi:hypothetical protein